MAKRVIITITLDSEFETNLRKMYGEYISNNPKKKKVSYSRFIEWLIKEGIEKIKLGL